MRLSHKFWVHDRYTNILSLQVGLHLHHPIFYSLINDTFKEHVNTCETKTVTSSTSSNHTTKLHMQKHNFNTSNLNAWHMLQCLEPMQEVEPEYKIKDFLIFFTSLKSDNKFYSVDVYKWITYMQKLQNWGISCHSQVSPIHLPLYTIHYLSKLQ